MKISRDWLQNFFDVPLPSAQDIADALTFHAFEIESVENDILDVKVTPNRGHDALCHRGIAKELSAILDVPMKSDPLRESISLEPKTDRIKVTVEDSKLCPRFTASYIRGVKVGPSPEWLRVALESVSQKSINNIVDATNYVMFHLGQPLHAFDAGKLKEKDGSYAMTVRLAKRGEKLIGLDDKEYELTPSMLVIEDAHAGQVASIAGIKGGKPTGIDEATTDIVLEAANWNGVTIRKTSQALKLRTDASDRFQQVISPELAAYGVKAATELILKIAGGEFIGFIDAYPESQKEWTVPVSLQKINAVLGTELAESGIAGVFKRLGMPFEASGGDFVVTPPFERLDLIIPEDLIEEVGRIVGYERVPEIELPALTTPVTMDPLAAAAERVREELVAKGYSEVFTSVFAEKGERGVLNKVGGERPYLRATLVEGLREAQERNVHNKDLLGLSDVQLFEIGTVWSSTDERVLVGTADAAGVKEAPLQTQESAELELPRTKIIERYKPFSKYPCIVRDVSLWVPSGTDESAVQKCIETQAGDMLIRLDLFDRFEKGRRTSLAFRLIFQSFDKTLTDHDANERMESVYAGLREKGYEIR